MGKVKSAIITSLLVAAIIVLALFASISCNVPGSAGVKRYNSFLSSIHLGSDLTGEAYAMLYPDGVLSTSDYRLVADDEENEDSEDFKNNYVQHGGLYVAKDEYESADGGLKESVAHDADILTRRFGEIGYSKYSVEVVDDYAIRIAVPTNFTYSAYNKNDTSIRSDCLTEISNAVRYLTLAGDLSLRNGSDYDSSKSIISINDYIGDYFSGVSKYSMGGTHAVKIDLTKEGMEKLNKILTATASDSSENAYFFIGETSLGLTIKMGEALENRSMFYQAEESYAKDFAVVIKSVINGDVLTNEYNQDTANSTTSIETLSSSFGDYSAIYLLVALLLVIVGAIVYSIIRYKKLGIVNMLMVLIYSLALVCALMLIEIQLTIAGAFTAVLGLLLMVFSNCVVFEAVRKETAVGRTIEASVKLGYKKTLTGILDMHIILVVIAAILALIGVGDIAACGLIFFISVIASYVLYWFTRFMWYVLMSPAHDKFKFCGFKREAIDDED